MITISPCPKGYTKDLDKSISPEETIQRVSERLASAGLDILRETRRTDTGRLGIPVYLSVCGDEARRIMPSRKQMGKGSSPEQAQASALMELMERYAFFSFWEASKNFVRCSFSEAQRKFKEQCIPIAEITRSVHDSMGPRRSVRVMDCVKWQFYPATRLSDGETVWLPLDWFRLLSEFNGTAAGNTQEESLLQGLSELIERHVCALVDRDRAQYPTILPESCEDPTLRELLAAFQREGIELILKDFSLGMPMPTVAALAWDPKTFPESSEIVFTAGTASSPAKAAIRAVTEVAQLAGDFCTHACYEASGLPKFTQLDEIQWLLQGEEVTLQSLPSIEADDIAQELRQAIEGLAPLNVYAVETTHPLLGIPAHYLIVPGLFFRERDKNENLGLFVGRKVSEEQGGEEAKRHLETIATVYPVAHFLPFFSGMLALKEERLDEALELFTAAIPRQPENESKGLAAFYAGYVAIRQTKWEKAEKSLRQAVLACPSMKEYQSYLGLACFKQEKFEEAIEAFQAVLGIDKGSAIDLANLGICEKKLGRIDHAIEHLSAALDLDPQIEFARNALLEIIQLSQKENS